MGSSIWQERTALLITEEKLNLLSGSHVFVAGLGGVGAYAAEMLCRAGVGRLTIADSDRINPTNRNRQLLALASTEGMKKTTLMKNRLLDVNPDVKVECVDTFLRDELTNQVLAGGFDYVVDAIDTLSPKVFLIHETLRTGIPLVSSMGAGGKIDPALVRVAGFEETHYCNLARMLRKRLRKLGVTRGFKAVFSVEPVMADTIKLVDDEPNKKSTMGTISYMPAIFGCYCASVVIRDLIETDHRTVDIH